MKNFNTCEICAKRECFLFKNCVPEWHDELNKNKTCTRYEKNQVIITEGEPVEGVYFIQSGKVKVFKESHYRGQIVRLAKDGDVLGHRAIGGESKYQVSATTLEESLICFVKQDYLTELLKNNAMMSMELMMYYADELKKTETQLRNMAIMTVRERVADALLMVQETFGTEENQFVDVEFSRQDIAEIAGTYPDQVSRCISEFRNDRILKVEGKRIMILQPEKLEKVIEKYN